METEGDVLPLGNDFIQSLHKNNEKSVFSEDKRKNLMRQLFSYSIHGIKLSWDKSRDTYISKTLMSLEYFHYLRIIVAEIFVSR